MHLNIMYCICCRNFSLSSDINETPDQLNVIHPSTSKINNK